MLQGYDLAAFITINNDEGDKTDTDFNQDISKIKLFIHKEMGSIVEIKYIFICNDLPIDNNGAPMKDLIRKVMSSVDGYNSNDNVYSSIDNNRRVRELVDQYRNYDI